MCARFRATLMAFAALPLAVHAQDTPTTQDQSSHLARNLAATCANCHGTNGRALGSMKALAGVKAERIITALVDFKSGALHGTIMPQIARGYSDQQIRLIAQYLAAQEPRP